jgi:hypothetical protein
MVVMKRLGLLAILVAAGCTRVESDDILTSGISADISARAKGDGTTTVEATLYLGNPLNLNFVDLTADDRLVASNGDQTKVMLEVIILNAVGHSASFQSDAEDDEFVVNFQRTIDEGAPRSAMTLPAQFAIAAGPASASRAASLDLTWSPGSPDQMTWSATGDCIDNVGSVPVDDTGTATIAAGTLKKRTAAGTVDNCMVTVTMRRFRDGDLDLNYGEGGAAYAIQERTLTFMSTP